MSLVIAREAPDQPEVVLLLEAADARAAALYPVESRHGLDLAALLEKDVRFLVARMDGQAVGCGGYEIGPDGTAELKRIFVVPEARGQAVGKRLVLALEDAAMAEGVTLMRLETGVKSDEALRLYERHGYARRGVFGDYPDDPLSVFMEKRFTPATP
jgi:putative acetyltransferase